jgi:hypothetical protein
MLECRNLSLIACQQMRRNYGESGNDLMKSLSTLLLIWGVGADTGL